MPKSPYFDIPVVGPSENVPQDDAERTLNMYAEVSAPNVYTSKPTPGTILDSEVTGVSGGCRGQITIQGRYFVVVGALFLEKVGNTFVNNFVNPPAPPAPTPPCPLPAPFYVGAATLSTTSGKVAMVANNPPGDRAQILIVDDLFGYVFELGASAGEGGWVSASVMAARGFVGGNSQAAFCAGRGIAIKPDTAQWQFSKLYDFTNWCDSTDTGFATCLSLLDGELKAVLSNGDVCYFFSGTGFEVWQNVGRAPNPLQRVLAFDKIGISAPNSAVFSERSAYWLGGTAEGQGVVYTHSGGGPPQRISDHALERNIAKIVNTQEAFASSMYSLGHDFYILNFISGGRSFAFDSRTGLWHERAQRIPLSGALTALPFVSVLLVDGKYLGIDYRDGKIWALRDDVYQDAGNPIIREHILPPIPSEGDALTRYQSVELFGEVGNTPAGKTDPILQFEYSTDRGQTWSEEAQAVTGGDYSYETRVKFSGIGSGYSLSIKFRIIANQYISWRKIRIRAR